MSENGLPEIGDVVAGRYRLVEEIGRGGFGVVFRAMQLGMERNVAVKMLHPAGNDEMRDQMRERFKREAMMARNLSHPNSIQQYDFGETPGGLMYLVLEYLDGKNLVEIIRASGGLGDQRVFEMAHGILKALAEAHAQGIVHRDLKPANIMLCNVHGERDFVKVLDFGIAKTIMGDTDLTANGVAMGSPAYMAPEVLMGMQPSPAADTYSLAITLGESIIGKPIIKADNSVEAAQAQLSPDPLKVPPELMASGLWPWLSVAMNKEATLRFQNADEMLQYISSTPEQLQAFVASRQASNSTTSPLQPILETTSPLAGSTEAEEVEDLDLLEDDEEDEYDATQKLDADAAIAALELGLDPTKPPPGHSADISLDSTAPRVIEEAAVTSGEEYDEEAPTHMISADDVPSFLDVPNTPLPSMAGTGMGSLPAPQKKIGAPPSLFDLDGDDPKPISKESVPSGPSYAQKGAPASLGAPQPPTPSLAEALGLGGQVDDEARTEMVDISGGIPEPSAPVAAPAFNIPTPALPTAPAAPALPTAPAASAPGTGQVGDAPTQMLNAAEASFNPPSKNLATPALPGQPQLGDPKVTEYMQIDINQLTAGQKKTRKKYGAIIALLVLMFIGGLLAIAGTLFYLSSQDESPGATDPVATTPIVIDEPVGDSKPASRKFRIYSVPEGAAVFAGEEQKGVTPLRFKVDSADLPSTIRVELEGHETKSIELTMDGDSAFDLKLQPSAEEKPAPVEKVVAKPDPKPASTTKPSKPRKPKKPKKPKKPSSDELIPLFD